jgi:ribosomal protein S4
MKKLTPELLRRIVLEEKKKVEAKHAKENAKAKKDYHLDETEEQWADATPPASTEYKPGDKDMKAAKMLKEEEIRLRRRLQAVMERRLALKRRIMESL